MADDSQWGMNLVAAIVLLAQSFSAPQQDLERAMAEHGQTVMSATAGQWQALMSVPAEQRQAVVSALAEQGQTFVSAPSEQGQTAMSAPASEERGPAEPGGGEDDLQHYFEASERLEAEAEERAEALRPGEDERTQQPVEPDGPDSPDGEEIEDHHASGSGEASVAPTDLPQAGLGADRSYDVVGYKPNIPDPANPYGTNADEANPYDVDAAGTNPYETATVEPDEPAPEREPEPGLD
jgi:hypothetical protein